MIIKDWVSVMIPCYNGEKFLSQLLECLLNQVYQNIQVIIADDGSIDNSSKIVKDYIEKYEDRGKKLIYLYQDNKGLAGAINLALSSVDTEFCAWMDVDDRLDLLYFSKMISYLKKDKSIDWVMCKGLTFDEDNLLNPIGTLGDEFGSEEFAEDLLTHRVNCSPGLYVVKTDSLFKVLGEKKHIYDENKRMGQNMQLLCPMAFKYKRPGRIDERLFFYTIRKDSMSHAVAGLIDKELEYIEHIQDIKINTIKNCYFLNRKYISFLLDKMRCFELTWKYQRHHLYNEGINNKLKNQIRDYIAENHSLDNRKVAIWGFCDIGKWWEKLIAEIYDIEEVYYVDSNIEKCDGNKILYKESINANEIFLIIPIGYHIDIINCLKKYNYTKNDYLYFEEILHEKFIGEMFAND